MKKSFVIAALCAATALYIPPARADVTDPHHWQLRLRTIDVSPDESSSTSNGGKITASARTVPELDISYFWTDNIST